MTQRERAEKVVTNMAETEWANGCMDCNEMTREDEIEIIEQAITEAVEAAWEEACEIAESIEVLLVDTTKVVETDEQGRLKVTGEKVECNGPCCGAADVVDALRKAQAIRGEK